MIKNVHGNTVDFLGEAIVAGRYAEGASIPPEPTLCEQLGVSRTVVREAVKALGAKGLITTGPKVGTRVLASDKWNWFDPDVILWQSRAGLTADFLRDLQEMRRIVEPAIALARNGVPVGELRPLRRHRFVAAEAAIEVFRGAPGIDYQRFRRDLGAVADQTVEPRA